MKRTWAVLLALTACGRSCGCEEEKVYETLKKPVRVELVRHLTQHGGRFSLGPTASFTIHVETTPPFDEPTTCESVDLSENEKGTVVAFRCKHEGAWQAIRLGADGTHVLDCASDLGSARKPDYARLEPIEKAAPKILDCHERGDQHGRALGDVYDAVARAVRASGGEAGVRTFLAASSTRGIPDTSIEDPWVRVVLELSKSERADVQSDSCPALLDSAGGDSAYVRAARLCPLGDPRIATAALDRIRVAFLPNAAPTERSRGDSPLEWALVIALRARPSEAGALACTFATATEKGWRRDLAIAAIGASNTACPAALVAKPCGAQLDCDGGLCTAADLRPELDAWLASTDLDGGARAFGPTHPTGDHALLAADYAAGALPRELVLRNARRHYAIDAGASPACTERLALGAACSCETIDDTLVCGLPLDGGRLERNHCSVRADDRARTVGYVQHACIATPDGGACTSDVDCCDGVTCVKPDGGYEGVCR